jgi:hypothetical protein
MTLTQDSDRSFRAMSHNEQYEIERFESRRFKEKNIREHFKNSFQCFAKFFRKKSI